MNTLALRNRILSASVAICLAVTLIGSPAFAAVTISACGQTVDGQNGDLDPAGTANEITYDHDDPPCVTVKNGYDFDFKGYKIRCVPGAGHTSCQSPAIKCEGTAMANSIVEDTVGGSGDHDFDGVNIGGSASIGVLECGTVRFLKIDGSQTGIAVSADNGNMYKGNVVWPAQYGTAMDLILQDLGDRVVDNRTDGGNYGIKVYSVALSGAGPLIDHNVVREFRVVGIYSDDELGGLSGRMRIEKNAVLEGGDSSVPFLVKSQNATFDGNVCEVGGPCACELDYLTPEAGVNPTSNCF